MSNSFGDRVRQARLDRAARLGRDVTKSEVADAMGVTGMTVGRWERDEKEPSLETIAKLATVLEVDPAWLAWGIKTIRGTPEKAPPNHNNNHVAPIIGEVSSPGTRRGVDELTTHERSHQVAARQKKGKARRKRA